MENRFLVPGTIKQGYLTKSPPLDKNTAVFKGWKKRWVILYLSQRELFLQYYENEESARGSSPPKSTVSLRFCEKVDVDLEHSTYKNVFAIHLPERIYYFSAPSHFEMTEWGDTICSFLKVNKDQHESTAIIGGGGAGSFSTMPLSGRYGTHASNSSTIPMSSPYGTYGLAGPSPTSPGHYGSTPYSPITRGGLSESSSSYGSLSGSISPSFSTIQGRGLPPLPPESNSSHGTSKSLEDQAPPVPPRFHSNLYSATPTR